MQNRYPNWVYVALVFVSIIGFIYAVPNIYGDDPALQISPASNELKVSTQTMTQTKSILQKASIPYKSMKLNKDDVLVRFLTTDNQLKARELIKTELGKDYTVASNLAPSTPYWLTKIGATPMKQGLDLRGGVHFLLQVDVNSVISRRVAGMMKDMGQEMRSERIRYALLRQSKDNVVTIGFRKVSDQGEAYNLLRRKYPNLIFEQKTKQGRHLLQAHLSPQALNNMRQYTIEQTMTTLRNRVNELGVAEAVVQQQGANRIAVDLPGIQDSTRAKQILGGTATLEFRMVDEKHDARTAASGGLVPVGSALYKMSDGRPILLKDQVVLSGDSITSAISSFDQQTGQPAVNITLGGGGESLFKRVTRESIGKRMAIVYIETKTQQRLVDGKVIRSTHKTQKVISAPVIQNALGNNFVINGLTDVNEARNLALLLRAGALPAAIFYVEERIVGPTLGRENIRRGLVSLTVGMLIILIVMVLYYRVFGLLADLALIMNLVLLLALLSLIDATLSLPAIAGIVLTMGMAVDANVLIYERIREELRNGATIQASIYAGYERALATIIDANVTTLIVAVILFAIGTGPIRGFALTLSIGLLTSMLTAVVFTRAIVNLIYGGRNVKSISIGIPLGAH
jgi:preprotein translocase subunit SecD